MKIAVIGYGFVGKAIAHSHSQDQLIILDPALEHSATWEQVTVCDAVYICVPSPSNTDGSCNTEILSQVLRECAQHKLVDVPIISKVTAPPNFYADLQQQYPNLVHCPEFLTAANNIADYENTQYLVVGGDPKWANVAGQIMTNTLGIDLSMAMITDIASASLYKYMMNCYLAAKVSFMNEFYQVAQTLDIQWDQFVNLAQWDQRIGATHTKVPGPDGKFGWAGLCFPKDTKAFVHFAEQLGVNAEFMNNTISVNQSHRQL